ncbi:MAG TPA: dephospho-CoA kinase [Pseudogracilibacillus sp.]|nr:dephospho-CoA kinase [Pseudogracilibacillus sp.]
MALVIGLTGSIGTGKTLIATKFQEIGIPVVDADKIARLVVEKGAPAYEKIVATFGTEVLHDDGTLNRQALGSIVFKDEAKRKQLNNMTHPEIRKEMIRQRDEWIERGHNCVVLDIPLLYESKLTHFVDKVIVVYVDEAVQLDRILSRDNITEEEARARIRSQIPVAKKRDMADAVIDNNGSKEDSYKQLFDILAEWNVKT